MTVDLALASFRLCSSSLFSSRLPCRQASPHLSCKAACLLVTCFALHCEVGVGEWQATAYLCARTCLGKVQG